MRNSNEKQQTLDPGKTKILYTVQNEVLFDKKQEEAEEARWLWMVLQVSIEVNIVEWRLRIECRCRYKKPVTMYKCPRLLVTVYSA